MTTGEKQSLQQQLRQRSTTPQSPPARFPQCIAVPAVRSCEPTGYMEQERSKREQAWCIRWALPDTNLSRGGLGPLGTVGKTTSARC